MSSKIGLILSMLFVSLFMLLGIDLVCLEYSYSNLDSLGVTIGYNISKTGRVDNEYITYLSTKYLVGITIPKNQSTNYGDIVDFILDKNFNPIIISYETINLKVKRSTIIGFFG